MACLVCRLQWVEITGKITSVTVKLLQSELLSVAHVNSVSPTTSPLPWRRLGSSDGVEQR